MAKNLITILIVALALCSVAACKKEKKSNDIITKIAPRPKVPTGPKSLSDFKYEKKVEWVGGIYTITIRRYADKDLELSEDEDGRKYYDNKVQLTIKRPDGTTFYDRTFTKNDFKEFTNNDYGEHGSLVGFMFDHVEGDALRFGVSVGSPDPNSDEYVPMNFFIDKSCHIRISNATELDTGSDQERVEKPKTEEEMSEEEGV